MTTDCLTCPEPQNYAAVALQLQNTAMQTEACLFGIQKNLRAATNPMTTVITTTAVQTVPPFTTTELTFANTVNFSNNPVTQIVLLGPNLGPGVFQVGISLTATAAGAVNVNSLRVLWIRVRKDGVPSSHLDDFIAEETIYEPNNGNGVDMSLFTTVTLDGTQDLFFAFYHENSSSDINIAAGCTYWWSKLSDQVALRAV